jgi:hypothetical protein
VLRKFARDRPGDDVYAFAANQSQMFDRVGNPLRFDLIWAHRTIDRKQTLEQQGITARTLIHIDVDD